MDDFLYAGTAAFKMNVIDKIYDLFSIGSAELTSFKYIGLNIRSCGNCITIDQHHYVSTLTPIKISSSRAALKALLGQLNWILKILGQIFLLKRVACQSSTLRLLSVIHYV